jgi:nifR3 family TIM-barrel protein
MEGVTNLMFRRLIRTIGGTGLTYTEFIASSALANRGNKVLKLAEFDENEKPIALQIFGRDPETMADAARVLQDLGGSIVDINMGCPSKQVCAHSGGSALMKEPALAIEIVKAVRKAISIPLTVKMRTGFDLQHKNAPDLAYACQEEGVEAVTVHWRTREDNYGGTQEWDTIAKVKQRLSIPVIGNGDITDANSARKMMELTGCDGLMIGRGAIKNPWCFQEIHTVLSGAPYTPPSTEDKRTLLLLYLETYTNQMRNEHSALGKFKQIAKYFCETLPDYQEFRSRLLQSQTVAQAEDTIHEYFQQNSVYEKQ